MLRLAMADKLLNDLMEPLPGLGYHGASRAATMAVVRKTIELMMRGFNATQATAGHFALANGRVATIRDALSQVSEGPYGWPGNPGRLLQGLDLNKVVPFGPTPSVGMGGRLSPGTANSQSYLCPMALGPAQARQMGEWIALLCYVDTIETGFVCWIGRNEELDDGFQTIAELTGSFSDLSPIAGIAPSSFVEL